MKVIRGLFTLLVLLPLAAVVVVFAIHNRATVAVDLWPLALDVAPPLYVLVLGVFLLGFLAGGVVAWLSAGQARGRARQERYRLRDLEREATEKKQSERETTAGLPAIAKS